MASTINKSAPLSSVVFTGACDTGRRSGSFRTSSFREWRCSRRSLRRSPDRDRSRWLLCPLCLDFSSRWPRSRLGRSRGRSGSLWGGSLKLENLGMGFFSWKQINIDPHECHNQRTWEPDESMLQAVHRDVVGETKSEHWKNPDPACSSPPSVSGTKKKLPDPSRSQNLSSSITAAVNSVRAKHYSRRVMGFVY